ncbi:MAG: lysophospholipid acyltransferase family protein, partial [Pirellulaceae bacterium]
MLRQSARTRASTHLSRVAAFGSVKLSSIGDYLVYVLVRSFIAVVQAITIERCHAIACVLAYVANDLIGLRRKVVDDNIAQTYPHLSVGQRRRFSRRMWEHLFLMVCEVAHAPRTIGETTWREHVRIRDTRGLVSAMLDSRPCVIVTGHYGNFEIAGYLTGMFGFRPYTIARPLDNPFLHDFITRFREAKGQYMLPKNGSAPMVEKVLAAGGLLTLLADQYAGPKGCWVDFLGRPASCHKALALFTLTSGAPMAVIYNRRLDRPMQFELGHTGIADPLIPAEHLGGVRQMTEWYNRRLEDAIQLAPEQYWWVHRRWKGEPP